MTAKSFGLSDNGFAALEQAVITAGGKQFDLVRTYAILGNWQAQDPAPFAAQGYRCVSSIKPKTAAGFVLPTDIVAGKADAQLTPMYDHLLTMPKPRAGRHRFSPWHEADTYLTKGGVGTQADVDAAVAHMVDLFTKRPGYAAGNWEVSLTVTGYAWPQRASGYPLSIAKVASLNGVLAFDQPYTIDPEANLGPAVDYSVLHWPSLRLAVHEAGRNTQMVNGQDRAAWLAAFGKALQGKRYDNVGEVIYWNSADDIINASLLLTDAKAVANFQSTIATVPPPPAPPTTPVPNAELAALAAATQRVTITAAALDAAQSAHDDALAALVAASVAVNTPG